MADAWNWTAHSKLCFVTTGATAPFTALIESVLTSSSLDSLRDYGFTHLLVQYGSAKGVFERSSSAARTHVQSTAQHGSLVIDGIDFDEDNLAPQFRLVSQSKGLVISHAGTASRPKLNSIQN
jgi:beta-1,4-N-acetylglucosaminyltransferase